MDLLIATANRGKWTEIYEALKDLTGDLLFLGNFSRAPSVVEDQPTFQGNALKKARKICQWSGRPALADDSGLVVQALQGRPGVHSARYAGPDAKDEANNRRLLKDMEEVPEGRRQAAFVCVLALVIREGKERIFEGRMEGEILRLPRGKNGFGYDPLFFIPPLGKTAAELSTDEKNQISHRGRALQQLKSFLLRNPF